MITGVALPLIGFSILALLLPRLVLPAMPETFGGLIANGVIVYGVILAVAAGYFYWSYTQQDTRVAELLGLEPAQSLVHFLRLGVMSSVVWAPVMVLRIAGLHRHWKENTW
ncbi:MAG: hypothetical protein AAGK92_04005 [Pseudomonadota bacterium]